jgi:WD40 repeat protein
MPRRPRAAFAILLLTCFSTRTLAQDNRLLAKLPGPSGTAAEFSRDGKLILTAGGDAARVWDAETFEPVTERLRHGEGRKLFLASLSPDGSRVLTVCGPEAFLWDAKTGKRLLTLKHAGNIRCAAFAPAGDRLVTGGTDKTVRVWDLIAGGKQVLALEREATVGFAAFSPDGGRTFLTVEGRSEESGKLRLWDAGTGQQLWRSVVEVSAVSDDAYRAPCPPAAFSPDGKRVAWVPHALVCVADARDGGFDNLDAWREFDLHIFRSVEFSPDGKMLLVVTGSVQFLDATGDDLPGERRLDTEGVQAAVFSPDGRHVLTAARTDSSGVWDVVTGRRVLELPAHVLYDEAKRKPHPRVLRQDGRPNFAYDIPAVAFSPDGRRVAAGFPSDGFTGVWAVEPPGGAGAKK